MFSLFMFMAEKKPRLAGESMEEFGCSGEGTAMLLWNERLPREPAGELEFFLGEPVLSELCEGLSKKPVCLKGCWPRA